MSKMQDLPSSQDTSSIISLLDSLRAVYSERDKMDEFESEQPVFNKLIPEIKDTLSPLLLVRTFGLGSTATVLGGIRPKIKSETCP
jgi:hypothetical protein